jgi:hypothetical protein
VSHQQHMVFKHTSSMSFLKTSPVHSCVFSCLTPVYQLAVLPAVTHGPTTPATCHTVRAAKCAGGSIELPFLYIIVRFASSFGVKLIFSWPHCTIP